MNKSLIIFLGAVAILSFSCSSETGDVNLCGNSEIDMNEECDSENLNNQSCNDLGFYEGTLGCKSNCTFDTSNCEKRCGDNQIDLPHEECDGPQIGNASCTDEGFYSGSVICTDECQLDYSGCSGFCGDGELQPEFEPCDGELIGDNMTCGKAGYFSGMISCSEECTRETDNCIYHLLFSDIIERIQSEPKISIDSNNNLLITSILYLNNSGNTEKSVKLRKISSTGNVQWFDLYENKLDSDIVPQNQVLDANGDLYITGYTEGCFTDTECTNNDDSDIFLLKVSNAGTKLLTLQLNSNNSGNDSGNGITIDSEGNIYLAASSDETFSTYESLGSDDLYLFKYDAAGNQIWVKQFGTEHSDKAVNIVMDQNENIYLLSNMNDENSFDFHPRIYKIDTTGEIIWEKTVPELSQGNNLAIYNSQIYLVGGNYEALDDNDYYGHFDAFLIVFDLDGERIWSKTWGSSDFDTSNDVVVNSAGEIYITGITKGPLNGSSYNGISDIFILKTDSSGNLLWSKNWGSSGWDKGHSLAINQDDIIHFSGTFEKEILGQSTFDNASLVIFRFPSTHDFSN